mmetsp:Transcript_40293/g.119396  ORF Transcript_40293/g.119396 Transcript_40293/m.119396 type:complete len:267 (+) Transcript_40293:1007-1807(+)
MVLLLALLHLPLPLRLGDEVLRDGHGPQGLVRRGAHERPEARVGVVGQAEAREVPQVGRAALQRGWNNAEAPEHAPRQLRRVGPLPLELGRHGPGEEVDDGVAQVPVLGVVPGAVEEVEGAADADREVLEEGDQRPLGQELGHVGQHHGGAVPRLAGPGSVLLRAPLPAALVAAAAAAPHALEGRRVGRLLLPRVAAALRRLDVGGGVRARGLVRGGRVVVGAEDRVAPVGRPADAAALLPGRLHPGPSRVPGGGRLIRGGRGGVA